MDEDLIAVIPSSWPGLFKVRYDPQATYPYFIVPSSMKSNSWLIWALIGGGILALILKGK